jgi:hypothetical protein
MIDFLQTWIPKTGLALLALLAPIHSLMIATGVLIFMDLFTGLWRAIKVKEPITSNGLRRTVTKLLAYQLAIITAWIMQTYLMVDFIPPVKIVASVIAITEAKSILENLSKISGTDLWSLLLEKFQGSKDKIK